jgi:hypothetical protein
MLWEKIKQFFSWNKRASEQTGVLIEAVPVEKNEFKEIVAQVNSPYWQEKKLSETKTYPSSDQKRSYMCVAFSMALFLNVLYFIKYEKWLGFSEAHLYQRRLNKSAGMYVTDVFNIAGNGTTLKLFTNENINTDADADGLKIENYAKDIGKTFAIGQRIAVPFDIDTIASVMQTTNKPMLLMTFFTSQEWSQQFPQIQNSTLRYDYPSTLRHEIVAVDTLLYKGIRYLKIMDSAKFGGLGERYLNADWVSRRIIDASYSMNFKFQENTDYTKPKFLITKKLLFGQTDEQIKNLQDILKFEGVMPTNIASTGYFGTITKKALFDFQLKYGLDRNGSLDMPTIAVMQQLYG